MMNEPNPEPRIARMKPCCMAVSVNVTLGSGRTAHLAYRRWRALSLDDRAQLAAGEITTNADDALGIVRDKVTSVAHEFGYEPQQFILEKEAQVQPGDGPRPTERT